MLVKCPECELQVSDRAIICPHCGYPLKGDDKVPLQKKSNKRKRLPNGFGQITKLNNPNLRNPYRAMVTVGKDSNGKPICKLLKPNSYFKTYNDAYAALLEYNKNPYDLSDSMMMFELYERWSEEYFKTLKSDSSIRTITNAWKYCSSLYRMRVIDIRTRHLKGCLDDASYTDKDIVHTATSGIKFRMKSLFNLIFDYALEYELVDRNYARCFSLSNEIIKEQDTAKRGHIPFTDSEMQLLWDNVDRVNFVNVLLIQCYSGWRPQELGLIEISNVDIDNWTYIGGIKTSAGENRIVPIHTKIRGLVKDLYDQALTLNSKYLINCTDTHTHRSSLFLSYDKYQSRFNKIVEILHLNPMHRAHDGRKHFVTLAKKYKVDEYAIKYIVGHAINDVTEKVYTERTTDWLREEIEKIE